jgi:hypothetical protein
MESVLPAGASRQPHRGACVWLVLRKQERNFIIIVVIDRYSISFLKQEFALLLQIVSF